MKNLLLIAAMLFLFACTNDNSNKEPVDDTAIAEEEFLAPEEKLLWIADYDTVKAEFFMRQQRQINVDSLTPVDIINDINGAWENIKLQFEKTSNDTVFVSIPNSVHLTERMGSAGASGYIAAATYSLTELKNIRYINYQFKEGDHLAPGTYSRESFKDFK
jgi:hypothetical protein